MHTLRCRHILRDGYKRYPCEVRSSVVWIDRNEVLHPRCFLHREEAESEAGMRGWTLVEPNEVAA